MDTGRIETISKIFLQNKSMKYDFYDEIVSDNLKDIYIKYRTSELCNYINTTTNLSATLDFRDKQGIVNIWCNIENYDIIFLIQIQHNEYRYCLIYGDETENDIRESIANTKFLFVNMSIYCIYQTAICVNRKITISQVKYTVGLFTFCC